MIQLIECFWKRISPIYQEFDVSPIITSLLFLQGRRKLFFSLSLSIIQTIEAAIFGIAAYLCYIHASSLSSPRTPLELGIGILTSSLLLSMSKLCMITHHYRPGFLVSVFGLSIPGWFGYVLFLALANFTDGAAVGRSCHFSRFQ